MNSLTAKREDIIEEIFDNFEFAPEVKDVSGWQHDEPDVYHRTVFLENGNQPSTFAIFSVTFKPKTNEVLHFGL